jgi:hypothetical protein
MKMYSRRVEVSFSQEKRGKEKKRGEKKKIQLYSVLWRALVDDWIKRSKLGED